MATSTILRHRYAGSLRQHVGLVTRVVPLFVGLKQNVHGRLWTVRHCQRLHTKGEKKGLVYISSSVDTYANLAFEDWIHDHWDLSNLNILLLWRNEPSIVIGRHQNPWTECNIREVLKSNVKLARRRSGGGTVYHDLGNINCTFFTHRDSYDRKHNLQMVVDGLADGWPHLDIHVNSRDDLMLNQFYKISGTAARLSRTIAYHHFTLLHSANTRVLSSLLNRDKDGIKSNATESVKSPVMNLRDAEPRLSQDCIVQAIAKEFYSRYQPYYDDKVYTLSPIDEKTWQGITQMKQDLMSWKWIYGKTPKFHVEKKRGDISAIVHVTKGLIEGVVLQMPYGWIDIFYIQQLTSIVKGKRFLITDVAMTIHIFLKDVDADADTKQQLQRLCNLIEDCIS